ncbi:MAG: RHS repeat-associated core domain-containing protein [Verrucomicrobiales bacterium]|nr:RHS repeat-associated core domain-containing protein [Verrucomicrobiales bacterium]
MKRSAHPEGRGHREAVTESNMIAEFDEVETPVAGASDPVLSATTRFYAWGLDLSGTPQGAGGVGGLLLVQQTSANGDQAPITHHLAPSYDGNGNITAYLDIVTGQPVDQYEYDAFGRTLGISRNLEFAGTATTTPPHRFSTKYTDIETGLMEYGYREYDAEKGRWLSRDPIEERGGVNLYAMVRNRLLRQIDPLGNCGCRDDDEKAMEHFVAAMMLKDAAVQTAQSDPRFTGNGTQTQNETGRPMGWFGVEYCGILCRKCDLDGTFRYGAVGPWAGESHTCDIKKYGTCADILGDGWETFAWFHTHPDDAPFSDDDRGMINQTGMDGYLGYPEENGKPNMVKPPGVDPATGKPYVQETIPTFQ